MIKLFERLPDSITVDGRKFRCDFDFRNVLKMLDIMQKEDIYPDARDYLCVKCVISHRMPQKTVSKAYTELCTVLFGKPVESAENARIMSYEQDAGLIRAAFRQVYGIDLYREKLNWFEFVELLQNLPEGNRFEEILDIRARPLPAPTKYNQKEREWLMKAKQSVRLHLTEQEQAKKYDADVGKVFAGLIGIIKREQKEVTNNNGE
jgi:hypothetical protein